MSARFMKLVAVGGAAFIVDAGILLVAIEVLGLSALPARLVSFGSALAFSYVLNRSVTFADRPRPGPGQFFLYVLASTAAGVANFTVFIFLLGLLSSTERAPYIAMPAGVGVGLLINYVLYNVVVFAPRPR